MKGGAGISKRRLHIKLRIRGQLPIIIACICGLGGVATIIVSHAATSTASIEAEAGSINTGSQKITDTTASGGMAVKFGGGQITTTATICTSRDSSGGVPGGTFPGPACTGVPASMVPQLRKVPSQVDSGTGWHWDYTYGFVRIDDDTATLDKLDVDGGILDRSNHKVTIKNSYIRYCVGATDGGLGPGSSIIDSEMGGGSDGVTQADCINYATAASPNSILMQRVNFHHLSHAFHPNGGVTFVDNYVHDLILPKPSDTTATAPHIDALFIEYGNHVYIRHNNFAVFSNAIGQVAYQDKDTSGTDQDIVIQNNLFQQVSCASAVCGGNGGASNFGVGIENWSAIRSSLATVYIKDNVFTRGWKLAPMKLPSNMQPLFTANVTGNVFDDGTAISTGDIGWDSPRN